jgi:hypothetical protein
LYAQQLVPTLSFAQSAAEVHSRAVYVTGFSALPQPPVPRPPGGFSAQVVWHVEAKEATEHRPRAPPLKTIVPQQTVPAPHWSVPVLPAQSKALAGLVQLAAHVSLLPLAV